MQTCAVVLEKPKRLDLGRLDLADPTDGDVIVDIAWSGISTGTERLLWSGRMPPFPGMGYPLVPGYEAAGEIVEAGAHSGRKAGEWVFVPGANCFGPVRGLFGGAAQRLVTKGSRVLPIDRELRERSVLIALAATAHHAIVGAPDAPGPALPELIIGHGIVGRLLARLTIALGGRPPVVWDINPVRRQGSHGYAVLAPEADERRDYRVVVDASGDAGLLDTLVSRTAKGGEIVLAGFYEGRIGFDFVPAFLRETRMRIAAEWSPRDLDAVRQLLGDGRLSLDGLITHIGLPQRAGDAYQTAFEDSACLKMVLNWGALS
ncbi:MAG: chlorophyll synthesis pathway protein BchC [Hyphomicrobiaceae bacterium]